MRPIWQASTIHTLVAILFVVGVIKGLLLSTHLPQPKTRDAPVTDFSEQRASDILNDGFSKARAVGTPGWLDALNRLRVHCDAVQRLNRQAGKPMNVSVIESSYGTHSFMLSGLGDLSTAHTGVTNLELHLTPWETERSNSGTKDAILINAHFDSVPNAPGAADCGHCVASSIELAHALVQRCALLEECPDVPVVFLFNGAEELLLLGADAFIKRNPSMQIGAFVNIEATGSGGRPYLFQERGTFPLLHYFRQAPYALGSTIAEELYRYKVFPALTDFQILSQKAPGIDIALVQTGSTYHTREDKRSRLETGCMQALGDNLLALTYSLASTVAAASQDSSIPDAGFEKRLVLATEGALLEEDRSIPDSNKKQSSISSTEPTRYAFSEVLGGKIFLRCSEPMLRHLSQVPLILVGLAATNRMIPPDTLKHALYSAWRIMLMWITSAASAAAFAITRIMVIPNTTPMVWYAHPQRALMLFAFFSLGVMLLALPSSFNAKSCAMGVTLVLGTLSLVCCGFLGLLSAGAFLLIAGGAALSWIAYEVDWSKHGGYAKLIAVASSYIPAVFTCTSAYLLFTFFLDKVGMMGSSASHEWLHDAGVAIMTATLLWLCVTSSVHAIGAQSMTRSVKALIAAMLISSSIATSIALQKSNAYSFEKPKRLLLLRQHNLTEAQSRRGATLVLAGIDGQHVNTFMNVSSHMPSGLERMAYKQGVQLLGALEPAAALFGDVHAFSNAPACRSQPKIKDANVNGVGRLKRISVAASSPFSMVLVVHGDIASWSLGEPPHIQQWNRKSSKKSIAHIHVVQPNAWTSMSLFNRYQWTVDVSGMTNGSTLAIDVHVKHLRQLSSYLQGVKEMMPDSSDVSIVDAYTKHIVMP